LSLPPSFLVAEGAPTAAGGFMANCPECDALVDLEADEAEEGEIVS